MSPTFVRCTGDVADYKSCRKAVEGVDKARAGRREELQLLPGACHLQGSARLSFNSRVRGAHGEEGAAAAAAGGGRAGARRLSRSAALAAPAVPAAPQVVCCAAARTTLTAELNRVELEGVANLCRAFLVGGGG